MSNRRKLDPPAPVRRFAAAYRCSDCTGATARVRRDEHGIWHVHIEHDPGCPVLAGTVDSSADSIRSATAAGGPDPWRCA